MILYLVDPVDKFPRIKYWFPFFDIVAGCAPGDAEKYHIQYWDTPCVYNEQLSDIKTKYDVYIRAIDNGRGPLIKQCFDLFIKNGLSCDFHIQMDSKNNKYDGIDCTIDRIPYNAMLREELQARILLEVVVPGVGAGTTLRYKEAVLYKRKIVTNNPSVFTLPYYNPKYIHYFSKPEDIDMSWMKCDFDASYEYDGKFSTDSFCKRISNYYKSLN